MNPVRILVALGGNLRISGANGQVEPPEILIRALELLEKRVGRLVSVSRFFRTPAYPPESGDDFVNAAAILDCAFYETPSSDLRTGASQILQELHRIEAELGRERTLRWGPRSADLDLLAAGDLILPDAAEQARWRHLPEAEQRVATPSELILPHPRLGDRAFVLVPLADIAPGWQNPATGETVMEMLGKLPPQLFDGIRPL